MYHSSLVRISSIVVGKNNFRQRMMSSMQELRAILRAKGLPVTGVKSDLIRRLREHQGFIHDFDPSIPIESATTPPSSWYVENNVLEKERTHVFGDSWLLAGFRHELQNVGDFTANCVMKQPYVLCVNDDNELRAYYNVCRHHGTQLVKDNSAGNVPQLVCPYHNWTYDLDGRLKKATRLKGIKEFRASNYSLKPIHVEEWGPFVFINFSHDQPRRTLAQTLTVLPDQMKHSQFDKLNHVRRRTYRLQCNWKVFIDNYLDGGYHVPHAHKGLSGNLDLSTYSCTLHDFHSMQVAKGSDDADDRISGTDALYAFLYPNLCINRYGPWMDTNLVLPLTTNECLVQFDYFLDDANMNREKFIEDSIADSHTVQEEDIMLCEAVQRGVESSAYDTGRYAPGVEFPMYHFHQLLSADLSRE